VTTKAKKNIYNNFFMSENYINIYNNLINYSRNKDLYQSLGREDNFSDRLTFFLIHFAFFLKNYKNKENKDVLQKIYDFNFRQLELSIRAINKKMKVYLNLFHAIVSEIHFWDELDKSEKLKKLSLFLEDFKKIQFFVDYFDDYNQDLKKKSLTFFLKGVSKS
jgi:cytochrome b pre-mRNA-processing protein 3